MLVRPPFLLLAALLAGTGAGGSEGVKTVAARAQERGRRVLDAAVKAYGGEAAIRGVRTLALHVEGDLNPRLQTPTPEAPFVPGRTDERVTLDLAGGRLAVETRNDLAGHATWTRTVFAGSDAIGYDLKARTFRKLPATDLSGPSYQRYYKRTPLTLLRSALDAGLSLRWLGTEQVDGRACDVVTFVHPDGSQIAFAVDSGTGLVRKLEIVASDMVEGESPIEFRFDETRPAGAFPMPRVLRVVQPGGVVQTMRIEARIDEPLDEAAFSTSTQGFAPAEEPAPVREVTETLADGVVLVEGIGGTNSNALAVAFKDHVVVVEAPGSTAACAAAIRRIEQAFPGKPIRFVAFSHHHYDHVGGLRAFLAAGATAVTTPGNESLVRAFAAAPLRDGYSARARPPSIEVIQGRRRVFEDETQRLELHDIGPNPHAKEMVIAYLPRQRIVFQADLFYLPRAGGAVDPAEESTVSFARALERLGLAADRIAAVHGETATRDDLQRALAASSTAR